MALDQETIIGLQHRLDKLRHDHQLLDMEIKILMQQPDPDVLKVHRFKKQKLLLKDQMIKIEALLVPDIIA